MKLLRTFRQDESDLEIFSATASPDEWAVPGTFVFAGTDPERLGRQERQAFAKGFLGLTSFGWSTLVTVAVIDAEEHAAAIEALAQHLLEEYDAADEAEARAAATEELAYAASLCEQPVGTVLSLTRFMDGAAIREQFRIVPPGSPGGR